MDHSSPGLIHGVGERQLTRSSDNQEFTIYDVNTTVGTLNTTREAACRQRTLADQRAADHRLDREQNTGERTGFNNRYLETLEPAPQGTLIPPHPHQASRTSSHSNNTQPVPPVVSNYDMTAPVGREEAIWRQTATKTAASFNNKDLGEYWERVRMLLEFYRTGIIPTAPEQDDLFIPAAHRRPVDPVLMSIYGLGRSVPLRGTPGRQERPLAKRRRRRSAGAGRARPPIRPWRVTSSRSSSMVRSARHKGWAGGKHGTSRRDRLTLPDA